MSFIEAMDLLELIAPETLVELDGRLLLTNS